MVVTVGHGRTRSDRRSVCVLRPTSSKKKDADLLIERCTVEDTDCARRGSAAAEGEADADNSYMYSTVP